MPTSKYSPDLWLKAQKDFIEFKGNLAQVAQQHGIAYVTLRRRAQQEEWGRKREEWRQAFLAAPKIVPEASVHAGIAGDAVSSPSSSAPLPVLTVEDDSTEARLDISKCDDRYNQLLPRILSAAERLLDSIDDYPLAEERARLLSAALRAADFARIMLGRSAPAARKLEERREEERDIEVMEVEE
jgi:hypothetical protein